jgi:hypothetical protein
MGGKSLPGIDGRLGYDGGPRFFVSAVAAPPPDPAADDSRPQPQTALAAVFRRMACEPTAPTQTSAPQLLGFAEPVIDVPPIVSFLPVDEAGTAPLAAPTEIEPPPAEQPSVAPSVEKPGIAALDVPVGIVLGAELDEIEPQPPSLAAAPSPVEQPEPTPPLETSTEPPPSVAEPASIRTDARVLPPRPAQAPPERPQNLVGRLGRRPVETPAFQDNAAAPAQAVRTSVERNRRLHRRAKLPAEFEIDGVPCTLIDVSIGGFAATGVPPIEPNALVRTTLHFTIDGIEVGTQLTARMVYVTQGRSAGRFVELSPSQMAFLRYVVTWRGESVGAVGTTTLLDAIAGGRERRFSSGFGDPPEEEPKPSWWAGLIGRKVNPPR